MASSVACGRQAAVDTNKGYSNKDIFFIPLSAPNPRFGENFKNVTCDKQPIPDYT
jgi:hypothetical protein